MENSEILSANWASVSMSIFGIVFPERTRFHPCPFWWQNALVNSTSVGHGN